MDREFAGLDQDNGLGCLGLRCPWVVDPGAKPSSLAEKGQGGFTSGVLKRIFLGLARFSPRSSCSQVLSLRSQTFDAAAPAIREEVCPLWTTGIVTDLGLSKPA